MGAVMSCPECGEEALHARAISWPLLDTDNDYGYSLSVECPTHGWIEKGDGWQGEELREAGLA